MQRPLLLTFLVALGCACPKPAPTATTTPITQTEDPPPLPEATLARQGTACGPDSPCPEGLLCFSYTGVAGARGPTLSTCELRCKSTEPRCPADQTCTVVADGPGRVCQRLKAQP